MYVYVCVCVLLSTGPWGMPKSWGGDVPISDSDHSETYTLSLIFI